MKAQIEPEALFNYHQHCNYHSLWLSIVLDSQDWWEVETFSGA
jgi:hypothetical protein